MNPMDPLASQRQRTLGMCVMLHAFTHVYQVALLPLYLLIQTDLGLTSVEQATLLLTAMMLAYFIPSYPVGMLADSVSRKKMLGFGLVINALGFIGLSYSTTYQAAVVSVAVAGFGGSFFHPAATALVARLFPIGTGRALGILGIGASLGFFIGPIYAGWRATVTGSWRDPVFDLGVLGLAAAAAFFCLAHEEPARNRPVRQPGWKVTLFPTGAIWVFFIGAGLAFSLRDFAGSSMGSLGSLFLQKAHGYSITVTGLALSGIFLASMISNPLFGGLSDRGRLRWTCLVLVLAATMVFVVPRVPRAATIPVLVAYGFFFMASYPMVEAALMESVPDEVRGRVFGIFITIGGLIGNLAHWLAGAWVRALGDAAFAAASYHHLYAWLALLIVLSLAGLPLLRGIRKREQALETPGQRNPDV